MQTKHRYIVGTSGYSFDDWVGAFYPPGTDKRDMFGLYVRSFEAVEVNYTFYRLPTARTMESLVRRSGPGFRVWVKANQATTHEGDRGVAGAFLEGIAPLVEAGRLAGVLLQFPQRFHRTAANRKYLAAALEDLRSVPLAVEFRHASWDHDSVLAGMRERNVTLAVPRKAPTATTTATASRRSATCWGSGRRWKGRWDRCTLSSTTATAARPHGTPRRCAGFSGRSDGRISNLELQI